MRRVLASSAFLACLAVPFVASAQQPAACTNPVTFCEGNSGYYVAPDDRDKVQPQLDPLLKDLRKCLDAAGGKNVPAAIVVRFDSDSKPVETKVEAGGYESLPCVADIQGKLVNARSVRATSMRCEYGCQKPKVSAPVGPTPVPVPGPTTNPTPTPAPTQTQTQPNQPPGKQVPPPPPAQYKPEKKYEKVYYGWQNLIADAASVTILAIGAADGTGSPYRVIGGIGYVFASPIIHWIHGNIGYGFGSLGMRVLLPPTGLVIGLVVGAIVGASERNGLEDSGSAIATGAIAGFFIGAAIPVAIDATAFGWEKVEVPNTTALRPKPAPSLTWRPVVTPMAGGAYGGLGGTF